MSFGIWDKNSHSSFIYNASNTIFSSFYSNCEMAYNLLWEYEADNSILDANGNSPHILGVGIPCLTDQLEVVSCFSGIGQHFEPPQNAKR